jgi:hypothetical protein
MILHCNCQNPPRVITICWENKLEIQEISEDVMDTQEIATQKQQLRMNITDID